MKWIKNNWVKILQYIVKGLVFLLCGLLFYRFLSFSGSVGQVLCVLVFGIFLILILLYSVDIDIIGWFKKNFKD